MIVTGCCIVLTALRSLLFKAIAENEPDYTNLYAKPYPHIAVLWGLDAALMAILAGTYWWAFACLKRQSARVRHGTTTANRAPPGWKYVSNSSPRLPSRLKSYSRGLTSRP